MQHVRRRLASRKTVANKKVASDKKTAQELPGGLSKISPKQKASTGEIFTFTTCKDLPTWSDLIIP